MFSQIWQANRAGPSLKSIPFFFLHPSEHNFEHAENSIRLVDLGIHTSGSLQSSSPAQQTNELTQL